MDKEAIEKTLENVSFSPSCLDMGWEWKVRQLGDYGFNFSLSFQRPDTNTGKIERGWGREWFVPNDATEKFVVMTAWLAMELILRHEAMEAFHYNNARILDPHKTLKNLAKPYHLGQDPIVELKNTKINKN